jgi:nitroreductase
MPRERTPFDALVQSRRMTRAFETRPVDPAVIDHCIDLASRAPSAGKTQGWHAVVLEGSETSTYWDAAMASSVREGFSFPHLLDAPVIMVIVADANAYVSRYSEDDKAATGWGESANAWPTPFWTVDASFATMTILLALHDAGLGALFFATARQDAVRAALGIPGEMQIIGTIAAGYMLSDERSTGRSARRPRRGSDQIIHRGSW